MPVILDNGSEELRTWLDPKRSTWSKDLQSLLKPFKGELEVYPVSKDVGKVGNNSPNFIIPVASSANKSNIANFFAKGPTKKGPNDFGSAKSLKSETAHLLKEEKLATVKQEADEVRETLDHEGTENNAPLPVPKSEMKKGIKRELDDAPDEEPPSKVSKTSGSPSKQESPSKPAGRSRSATSNSTTSPKKSSNKERSLKITSFFGK